MSALQYGWRDPQDPRSFWLSFASCTREPGTWREEQYAAARYVANRATARNRPIWIGSSGGIDSEIACRAFYDQGIDFSVLTLEHTGGTNRHDVGHAVRWCSERGVKHVVAPIDIVAFLEKDLERYADEFAAVHPFRYLQLRILEMVEERGGFAVMGGGEQLYQPRPQSRPIRSADMYLAWSNGNVIAQEWCRKNETEHEAYFHYATPELCLAYVRHPLVAFALENPDAVFRHPVNAYTFMRLVYFSVWDDLRPRYKWHGFENVRKPFEAAKRRLRERFADEYVAIEMPAAEFARQLIAGLRADDRAVQ